MELEFGVELVVRDDVDLVEVRVHVSEGRGQADDGGRAVGLPRGLSVVVEVVAHLVRQLH